MILTTQETYRKYEMLSYTGEEKEPKGKYTHYIIIGGGRINEYYSAVMEALQQTEWYQQLDTLI